MGCDISVGLKFDKSFVNGRANDPTNYANVQALTYLGHNMHIKVIAEGVETEDQRAIARRIGVDMLPGYRMSKAVSADETMRYLQDWPVAEVAQSLPVRAIAS